MFLFRLTTCTMHLTIVYDVHIRSYSSIQSHTQQHMVELQQAIYSTTRKRFRQTANHKQPT